MIDIVTRLLAPTAMCFVNVIDRNDFCVENQVYSDAECADHLDASESLPVDMSYNKAIDADQPPTNTVDPIEDHPINVTTDDEETLPPMPDMPLVHVDPPSMVSLPVDQGLIKSNKDKLSTNMMDPIEDQPINETTDDEEALPPMPDMPLVHVDPPSVVPIPVDQGFLSRYSPNEVVLAKRFNSYFWPAQISEVHSDKMYVEFFPLSEEMEKEEVSSEEDVKAFTKEEINAAGASLCQTKLHV
ncbi:unnamed protein product [Trichogramma brassicae]|uniref:PWWP domain-containing protein n=1 Tax=Trichogramma brassicae TaxID=86971 RepID=A0A6H5IVF5_9HYME|nr:unnamed protein product [Trichogramma brassicae]